MGSKVPAENALPPCRLVSVEEDVDPEHAGRARTPSRLAAARPSHSCSPTLTSSSYSKNELLDRLLVRGLLDVLASSGGASPVEARSQKDLEIEALRGVGVRCADGEAEPEAAAPMASLVVGRSGEPSCASAILKVAGCLRVVCAAVVQHSLQGQL